MIESYQLLRKIEDASGRIKQIASSIRGQRQLIENILDIGCCQRTSEVLRQWRSRAQSGCARIRDRADANWLGEDPQALTCCWDRGAKTRIDNRSSHLL